MERDGGHAGRSRGRLGNRDARRRARARCCRRSPKSADACGSRPKSSIRRRRRPFTATRSTAAAKIPCCRSMDTLLKKMRERLGESLGSIGETSAPLEEVTTKNLDALKAYSLGLRRDGRRQGRRGDLAVQPGGFARSDFRAGVSAARQHVLHDRPAREGVRVRAAGRCAPRPPERARKAAPRKATRRSSRRRPKCARSGRCSRSFIPTRCPASRTSRSCSGGSTTRSPNPPSSCAPSPKAVIRAAAMRGCRSATSSSGSATKPRPRRAYAKAREVGAPQLYLDPLNLPIAEARLQGGRRSARERGHASVPRVRSREGDAHRVARSRAADASLPRAPRPRTRPRSRTRRGSKIRGVARELADVRIALAAGAKDARASLTRFIDDEIKRAAGAAAAYEYSSYTNLALAASLALRNGEAAAATRALATLKPLVEKRGYFNLEQPYRTADCESRIAADARAAVELPRRPAVGSQLLPDARRAAARVSRGRQRRTRAHDRALARRTSQSRGRRSGSTSSRRRCRICSRATKRSSLRPSFRRKRTSPPTARQHARDVLRTRGPNPKASRRCGSALARSKNQPVCAKKIRQT